MMNIGDIAYKINELCEGHEIERLQDFRKRTTGSFRTYGIFSAAGIKVDDGYAFHDGGRKELQFNISNDEGFFRYGVAFSLEPSQSLPDPVAILEPRIERFNRFVKDNPTFFSEYSMWYWQNDNRSSDMKVQEIGDDLITNNTFIFIGNKIDKPIEKLSSSSYKKILETFDHLYTLYRYVQSGSEWIARICWNDYYWRKPSGMAGKSKNKDSYERQAGFGHEEWLLDTTKLLNGYHYGFLQPIGAHRDKYAGQVFDIHLYTIHGSTGEKWWLGKVNNAWVVDEDESRGAYDSYKKEGYLKEMMHQLTEIGIPPNKLKTTSPETFFNVRFRPDDLELLDEPQMIDEGDKSISGTYYTTFIPFNSPPRLSVPYTEEFEFNSGTSPSNIFKSNVSYKERSVEVDQAHNRMVSNSWKQLKKQYGKNNVKVEVHAGRGTKVDLVIKDGDSFIFYEFKSAHSFIGCIRDALGQLMEYAYFPDKKNAKKLVIVSDKPITKEGQRYMERLRQEFKLPVHYQLYNATMEQLEPTLY